MGRKADGSEFWGNILNYLSKVVAGMNKDTSLKTLVRELDYSRPTSHQEYRQRS